MTFELTNIVRSTNCFSANGWSHEVAEKYLFTINGKSVEAGFYTHYADAKMDRLVKQVIELPTSFGCPMKCAYCASSLICNITSLTTEALCGITDTLMNAHGIPTNGRILIALTGTGDASFTFELIKEYMSVISQKYHNFSFTISSCNWSKNILQKAEELSLNYNFRNIQSTFISSDEKLIRHMIPGLQHVDYRGSDIFDYIAYSSLNIWRINYLMLQSINDDDDSFDKFLKIIQPIKNRVVVRISSLNRTIASDRNGLIPATFQRSEALQSILKQNEIDAYLFFSKHNDNMSCGQLVLESILTKKESHLNRIKGKHTSCSGTRKKIEHPRRSKSTVKSFLF